MIKVDELFLTHKLDGSIRQEDIARLEFELNQKESRGSSILAIVPIGAVGTPDGLRTQFNRVLVISRTS